MTFPLLANGDENTPILLINYYRNYEIFFREDFSRLERLPDIDIDLGGGKRRTLRAWAAYGYTPTEDPHRAPEVDKN